MERKYLLPKCGNDYKANLHCHTTLSDGSNTPLEIKEKYMQKGYSIVAFTDHDVFIPHRDLCDENFLALNGFEAEFHDWNEKKRRKRRTTHLCAIALDEDIINQPCYHRSNYLYYCPKTSRELVRFDDSEPDFIREYTPENINLYMKKCKEKGFFVTYNHPAWSLETFEQYGDYSEMNAIEIINGGCFTSGYFDFNHRDFELFLRQGKRIFAVAGDDNHNNHDTFVAWTVIRAPQLTYKDICESLKNGNFYATSGPEIKSLYIEDGVMHVETDEARRIFFNTAIRHTKNIFNEDGSPVTSGSFKIDYEEDEYVRVTVVGMDGSMCYSNPYFIENDKR